MDDGVLVDKFERLDHLQNVHPCLELQHPLPSFYQLFEGIERAKLEDDVHVIAVLEHFNEPHYVLVLQHPVDLDLEQKLVPLPLFVYLLLGDYLSCVYLVILDAPHFEALSKSPCPQQFPPDVPLLPVSVE